MMLGISISGGRASTCMLLTDILRLGIISGGYDSHKLNMQDNYSLIFIHLYL